MLRALRTSLSARLGAAAVALALTGGPALAARPQKSEHRCQCKTHAGEHACDCARCHMAAAQQRTSAEPASPRCHRHLPQEAKHGPARPPSGGPCVKGTCGGEDGMVAPLAAVDAFPLPLPPAAGGVLPPAGRVEPPSGAARDAPSGPEAPPPRADRVPAGRA